MSRIDKGLEARLKSDPKARVRVIVRTTPNPGMHTSSIEASGLRVVHVSSLINALTIEGPAESVLKLEAESWVMGLEPDGSVHTMG